MRFGKAGNAAGRLFQHPVKARITRSAGNEQKILFLIRPKLGGVHYESRTILWRLRDAVKRILGINPETHGSHRLSTDPLACHEVLRSLWT